MPATLALLLTACSWVPPVDTALEPEPLTTLAGDLAIVQVPAAAGPGFVLLFDANNPPPPNGFGRPADLAAVSSEAWTEVDGVASAPWQLVGVPDGTWLLTALVDEDRDFNPFYDFTAGATCGDRTGAYLADLDTGEPQTLSVSGPRFIDGLTLLAGAPLATERPAFELSSGGGVARPASMAEYQANLADYLFTLSAVGVDHPLLQLTGPGEAEACTTSFHVSLLDADGDGASDPHADPDLAAFGLHDLWPKAYLVLGAYADGTAPAEGEAWISEAVVVDGPLLQAGYQPGDTAVIDDLPLLFLPGALHVSPDGSQEEVQLQDVPAGAWGILLVYAGGQAWMTPNDLADPDVAASLGVEPLPGQASVFLLQ